MLKIEQQMIEAISTQKSWKLSNTEVKYNNNTKESFVYLDGSEIAIVTERYIKVFDFGWRSNISRSRINAILNVYGNGSQKILKENNDWTIVDNETKIPFRDSYIFDRE